MKSNRWIFKLTIQNQELITVRFVPREVALAAEAIELSPTKRPYSNRKNKVVAS